MTNGKSTDDRLSTGIPGLDTVLNGGILPNRNVLVRGPPGAGKTLVGLHYLVSGAAPEENSLFINFDEPEEHLRRDAASFGIDLDRIHLLDLSPSDEDIVEDGAYDVFPASEVEGPSLHDEVTEAISEVKPDRVVIDPMTQLRYLAPNAYQFRKRATALLRLLNNHGATVVFTSQATEATPDDDLQFLSDGVIHIDTRHDHRTVRVSKLRGSDYRGGTHSLRISDEGISVAPRLTVSERSREFTGNTISFGVPELDELVHGGLERGTVTILTGPTGVGKTTTGLQFMEEAAGRGERSVLYSFEESKETLLHRAEAINIPVGDMIDQDTLDIIEFAPGEVSADEFAHDVRQEVEEHDSRIVMLDGVDGYGKSVQGLDGPVADELSTLARYLKNQGVTVLLVNEVHHVTGDFHVTEEGMSYIADNIIFLRHIEHQGRLRKVIGVLKKRASDYEKRLREFEITEHGIKVGKPLPHLRGVLSGTPEWDSSENRHDQ